MTNHNNSQSIPEETEDHHLFDLEPPVNGQVTEQTQNLKSNTKNIPKKSEKLLGILKPELEPIRTHKKTKNLLDLPKVIKYIYQNLIDTTQKFHKKNNFLTNKQNSQETFPEKQTIEDKSLDTTYNDSTNNSSQSKKNKTKKSPK
ncbi:hypothetical protein M0812_02121 [Anaeramoeba flamelloides]|uniref:Uncharacterized protein n=1 Tax=Anaeramoeba flamelloides TaxID=1746091 RepID=A0AAV7Z1H3_9EUKA|nr:hypothetical protein M0812_02121 [Anaeramoeba flamelloides]